MGATLYMTLEPCSHWGKTPPCAEAITEASIARVVCAVRDPDPRVNGRGFEILRAAGITVETGPCAADAKKIMSGFFYRTRWGVPELIAMDEQPASVPSRLNAMVTLSPRGRRLLTRKGTITQDIGISGIPLHRVPAWMGNLGLTSVAVSGHDPLVHI